MSEKIIKFVRAEIKSVNEKDFTLEAVISTKKVDRDGDIVLPEAFTQDLKYYKDHPVLLSSHSYGDLRKQIGEATKIAVNENDVTATFKYYVDLNNPEADWAWVLAQKGMASFSIGFQGKEFDWIKEKVKDNEGNTNEQITGRKFTRIELYEISQVVVASNRQALQTGRSLANEQAELCEAVTKAVDEGKIKLPEVVVKGKEAMFKEKQEVVIIKGLYAGHIGVIEKYHADECLYIVKAEDGCQLIFTEADLKAKEGHYSERLLGKGAGTPELTPEAVDYGAVIKEVVNATLKKEKK